MTTLKELKEMDDRIRPEWGVGVFAVLRDGEMRIIVDDLRRSGRSSPATWSSRAFVTHAAVAAQRFLNHDLTVDEYRAIGEVVALRLVALADSS